MDLTISQPCVRQHNTAERQEWILSYPRVFVLLDGGRPAIDNSAYPTARSVVRRAELTMALMHCYSWLDEVETT